MAFRVNHCGEHTCRGQLSAAWSSNRPRGGCQRVGRRRVREAPQQQVAKSPDAIDLDPGRASTGLDPRHASGPVAPCHGFCELKRFSRVVVRGQAERRRPVEAISIGRIDHQERAFAVSQCDRIFAEAQRRPNQRVIGTGGERFIGRFGSRRLAHEHRSCGNANDQGYSREQRLSEDH